MGGILMKFSGYVLPWRRSALSECSCCFYYFFVCFVFFGTCGSIFSYWLSSDPERSRSNSKHNKNPEFPKIPFSNYIQCCQVLGIAFKSNEKMFLSFSCLQSITMEEAITILGQIKPIFWLKFPTSLFPFLAEVCTHL